MGSCGFRLYRSFVIMCAEQTKNGEDGEYFHGDCSVPAYENDIVLPSTEQWDNGG